MKERPILFSAPMVRAILEGRKTMTRRVIKPQRSEWALVEGCQEKILSCPYGQVGDRLWVKETFRTDAYIDERVEYRATPTVEAQVESYDPMPKWKPSIFMPRKHSRITLEITGIRVERLKDITEEDAIREGINNMGSVMRHVGFFQDLWESINGPDSWEANPWVWVVEFKRII